MKYVTLRNAPLRQSSCEKVRAKPHGKREGRTGEGGDSKKQELNAGAALTETASGERCTLLAFQSYRLSDCCCLGDPSLSILCRCVRFSWPSRNRGKVRGPGPGIGYVHLPPFKRRHPREAHSHLPPRQSL